MKLASAKLLVGRKIVGVDLHPARDRVRGQLFYDPTFTLDNGARVVFVVDETEVGVYGVRPCYLPRERKSK